MYNNARLRYGGIFSDSRIANFLKSASEKISKFGQNLTKVWQKICGVFFDSRCSSSGSGSGGGGGGSSSSSSFDAIG